MFLLIGILPLIVANARSCISGGGEKRGRVGCVSALTCTFDAFPDNGGMMFEILDFSWTIIGFPAETRKDTDINAKYNAISRDVATRMRFVNLVGAARQKLPIRPVPLN